MNRLGEKKHIDTLRGRDGLFIILQRTCSINILGKLYQQLPMVLKDTRFGGKLKYMSLRRCKLRYTEIFVGRHIYYRYCVIYIIIITFSFATGPFYLTLLHSFIGCYFEYLPLYSLQVCGVSLTSPKYFKACWTGSFTST